MPDLGEPLSDREIDVLQEIAQGASNKQIAGTLDISPNTVKVHVRNLFAKLGASSRTEAVTLALQQGLLTELFPAVIVEEEEPEPEQEPAPVVVARSTSPEQMAATPAPVSTPTGVAAPARRNLTLIGGALVLVVVLAAVVIWQTQSRMAAATPEPFVPSDFGDSGWTTARPLDVPRSAFALVSSGLDVYVIGGLTDAGGSTAAGVSGDLLRYDSQTATWETLQPKPTPVSGAAAAIVAGQIYVAGGRTVDGGITNVVEVYSPAIDAWRSTAPLPVALSDSVALAWDNRLYLFGGDNGTAAVAAAFVYDPLSNGWRPLPLLPTARAQAAGGLLNEQALIVGGAAAGAPLAVCERFVLSSESWESCPPLLSARAGASAAVLFNRLYLFGGSGAADAVSGEQYDPQEDVWQIVNIPPLAEAVEWRDLGAAPVETRIYLVGGLRDGARQTASYSFNPLPFQFFFPSASSSSGP